MSEMEYEGNPKHKEPWQRGRKGSLCPEEISIETAQKLLEQSVEAGNKRYAVHNGRAYCAHCNPDGKWHGHPVGWEEVVPETIRIKWLKEGLITRSDIKRYWK
jgi:hypothetical protein